MRIYENFRECSGVKKVTEIVMKKHKNNEETVDAVNAQNG